MSLHLRASVLVAASPENVFAVICEPERLPEWNVSVERAWRVKPTEPVQLGTRAIMCGRLLGQQLESETEVVDYEPPHSFVTRAIRGPRLVTRFVLEPEGAATRVRLEVAGEVPGGAIGARLAEGFLRKELGVSLERLRALIDRTIA